MQPVDKQQGPEQPCARAGAKQTYHPRLKHWFLLSVRALEPLTGLSRRRRGQVPRMSLQQALVWIGGTPERRSAERQRVVPASQRHLDVHADVPESGMFLGGAGGAPPELEPLNPRRSALRRVWSTTAEAGRLQTSGPTQSHEVRRLRHLLQLLAFPWRLWDWACARTQDGGEA